MNKRKQIRNIYNLIVITLLIVGVAYVCSRLFHFGNSEYTDNAQVQRHITPVNCRVQGFIREIRFDDYQQVHRGDTLVVIDNSEYLLQLAQAEANLSQATSGRRITQASVATQQDNTLTAEASIAEAKTAMEHAEREYQRYKALLEKESVTRQQYDAVATDYQRAKERYQIALRQRQTTIGVKNEQTTRLSQNEAQIRLAEVAVDMARLNLSYTIITASADGVMSRKAIHEGQLVQPGQTLCQIVDANNVWIIANYRETQMPNIAVGHSATIEADALPGLTFSGKVESIAGATGSATSIVPQDNATGNFVKVEQRIPVRIALTEKDAEKLMKLKAGMNVECRILNDE